MPAFNQYGFGAGFDGGADTPASGSGAFNAIAFGAGFAGGADSIVVAGGAFNGIAFGSGFSGGADTLTGVSLTQADIDAIVAAIFAAALTNPLAVNVERVNGIALQGSGTALDPMRPA
jgi:hypothetical protein